MQKKPALPGPPLNGSGPPNPNEPKPFGYYFFYENFTPADVFRLGGDELKPNSGGTTFADLIDGGTKTYPPDYKVTFGKLAEHGTRAPQSVEVDSARVETNFEVRHKAGGIYFTYYAWIKDETDGTLSFLAAYAAVEVVNGPNPPEIHVKRP